MRKVEQFDQQSVFSTISYQVGFIHAVYVWSDDCEVLKSKIIKKIAKIWYTLSCNIKLSTFKPCGGDAYGRSTVALT